MATYPPQPPSCEGCPAHGVGLSYVPGRGPLTARVAIIGQGPGKEEAEGHWSIEAQARVQAPFIGRSGQKLDAWLQRVNSVHPELPPLRREDCWVDNTVRCLLLSKGKDRAPTAREAKACWDRHLGPALRALPNLQVVIPVGVPAIKTILGPDTTEEWAGGTYEWEIP